MASRGHKIAITVLVLTAAAAAATGITYAATTTTTKVVYACANARGTLKLLSHGLCPTGYSKVAINKTGPRGPRGLTGSTGPAGPGAFTLGAASSSNTTDFEDKVIPSMGLTAHAVCNAGSVGTQSGLYFLDTTASADYTVVGSYNLTAPGAHAVLAYQGGTHGNLASGLGPIEFTQTAQLNANGEFVLQADAGQDGRMTGDVTVTRSGTSVLVHFFLFQAASRCLVQADITPAT